MSMLQEKLAPIVISVYTRPDHFKKCILSLKENDLACESELFIYSDVALSLIDIEGFKRVTLINRDNNCDSDRRFK